MEEMKKAEDKVTFRWAGFDYTATEKGKERALKVLNPDGTMQRMEHLEAHQEIKEEKEQEIILRNIRSEDICEFILNNLSEWKDMIVIKDNIAKILWHLKHEKFDQLEGCFSLD